MEAILPLIVVLILFVLSLPPALKEKSWKRFLLGLPLSLFGILFPLVFFFLSAFLVPDSKDNCHNGWLDCFHLGKLALAPFVLWATAALYAVEVYGVKERTRPWIMHGFFIGAFVSSACALYGIMVTEPEAWVLLIVPIYTAIWYVLRTAQLIRAARINSSPLVKTVISSLPFWAASAFWSYQTYLTLPEHSPDCFVVTAASRGHRQFVGPFYRVRRRGRTRLANRQLITFWQFEFLWRSYGPRSHAAFRQVYNALGPVIARRIGRPWIADGCYLALKPVELFARFLVTRTPINCYENFLTKP